MSKLKTFIDRYGNILFFIGGFIFDTFTMVRIDSVLDLLWQFGYLVIITTLIVARVRQEQGVWTPSGLIGRVWHYETEALHFCYGGLLSGYVIFYFKSTSISRSLVFLTLIAALMIANEMPQIKRLGSRMRLGLYAFCVVSYLNYLLPDIIGRMGWWTFALAWVMAIAITYGVIKQVAHYAEHPAHAIRLLSVSPAFILGLVLFLYTFKLIPPVPLSLRTLTVVRNIERVGDRYHLYLRKPPWYKFWQTDNVVFPARPGEPLITFMAVFGPKRFTHQLMVHWSKKDDRSGKWITSDRVPMPITGGRGNGYRGTVRKEHYEPGLWRVEVETEDERVLGSEEFRIVPDATTDARQFTERWM